VFENILDHPEVKDILIEDIKSKKLPSSLLFHGDVYTGKLTAALELARVLSCELEGSWTCKCSSCEHHRLLDAPSTVMLGNRYFIEEIEACSDVLRRTRQGVSQYQFLRSVRKLTRRFDQQIWEGQDNKLKGLGPELEKIEIILEEVKPGNTLPDEKKLKKLLSDAGKICRKISEYISGDNIPISHIRNTTYWCHTTFMGLSKIVIIEGADSMGESSRNALLKIIEEPPPNVYFILLSTRKNKIIPTILSRVRPYNFKPRTNKEDSEILKRIFKDDSIEYRNLRDYFMGMKGVNLSIFRQYAKKVITALVNRDEIDIDEYTELLDLIKESYVLKIFLEEMISLLHENIYNNQDKNNSLPINIYSKWNEIIHETIFNRVTYNQSIRLLFETLLYQMREIF
jgi:DNA polymerase III delta prime subunit